MVFFALRRLNVDGEVREPGDPVPEAAGWPNLVDYLNMKHVGRADTEDDARALLAQFDREGLMSDFTMNDMADEAAYRKRRNLLHGEGTGAGTAPTADGKLRQPVSGPVLERYLATSAGIPGAALEDIQPGQIRVTSTVDQDLKRLATAAALGDERAQEAMDASSKAAIAQGEEFEQYVKDAVMADAAIHAPDAVEGEFREMPPPPETALGEGPRHVLGMAAEDAREAGLDEEARHESAQADPDRESAAAHDETPPGTEHHARRRNGKPKE